MTRRFHYGWLVVLAGFLTLFACFGLARFAYGMLLPGMRAGLGFDYARMGMISTGNFAGYLVSVALVPKLMQLLRPRATVSVGLGLIALCMLAMGTASSFAWLLVLYVLVGFGGGLANIPAMVLVSHWFRKSARGRAAGLMIAGNGSAIVFAGFFIPWLERIVADGAAWRVGWLSLGAIALVIALVVALLLRNDPAELGLEPVGRAGEGQVAVSGAPVGGAGLLLHLGGLYLIFGTTYMVYGTFIVSSMVDEYGLSSQQAGLYWSWVGVLSIFSGVLFGGLSDRIGRRGGLATVFAVQTAAYLLAGSGWGVGALVLSIILYGSAAFAIPTIMTAAVGDYFGVQQAARAFAFITFCFAAGQTIGPGGAGWLKELAGSFAPAFLASAALTGVGILSALVLPGPKRQKL